MITAPMIKHSILNAFLLFFFFTRPSSKMGTTNQMQRPIMMDNIIFMYGIWASGFKPPVHILSKDYVNKLVLNDTFH